jgi:hypothetical protein
MNIRAFKIDRTGNLPIQTQANTLAFKGIGNLILACTEDIFALFDQKSEAPISSSTFKN